MSNAYSGSSLRHALASKNWWVGVFGNMLSTVIGIALTIGIGAFVEYHNNKKLSREMMFDVVKSADDNGAMLVELDSLFKQQMADANKLLNYYYDTDGHLENVPGDSLVACLGALNNFCHICITRSETQKYFYSSQMMHQFNNTGKYIDFSLFVSFDEQCYNQIVALQNECIAMMRNARSSQLVGQLDAAAAVKIIIESHELTDYTFNVSVADFSYQIDAYKDYFKQLLEEMDATDEEYEEYLEENSTYDEKQDEQEERSAEKKK